MILTQSRGATAHGEVWSCHDPDADGPGAPCGLGPSEQAAVADYLEQLGGTELNVLYAAALVNEDEQQWLPLIRAEITERHIIREEENS